METKDKIIEILERCLEDKGKLPEFYADQILAEFKRVVEGKKMIEQYKEYDTHRSYRQGYNQAVSNILKDI